MSPIELTETAISHEVRIVTLEADSKHVVSRANETQEDIKGILSKLDKMQASLIGVLAAAVVELIIAFSKR